VGAAALAGPAAVAGGLLLRRLRGAARGARWLQPAALVTVAPPVQRFPVGEVPDPGLPVAGGAGREDELVDYRDVAAWAAARPRDPAGVIAGASHFFHGRLGELQDGGAGLSRRPRGAGRT
jgi:alpha/beta superfamily hydrolase